MVNISPVLLSSTFVDLETTEKVVDSVRNYVHHGKREVHSVWTDTRNIVFIPGRTQIRTLPPMGLPTGKPDHYECCHLRVRPLDGNRGRVASKGLLKALKTTFCLKNRKYLQNPNQTLYWYFNNLKSSQHHRSKNQSQRVTINIRYQPRLHHSISFA